MVKHPCQWAMAQVWASGSALTLMCGCITMQKPGVSRHHHEFSLFLVYIRPFSSTISGIVTHCYPCSFLLKTSAMTDQHCCDVMISVDVSSAEKNPNHLIKSRGGQRVILITTADPAKSTSLQVPLALYHTKVCAGGEHSHQVPVPSAIIKDKGSFA